LVSRILRNDQTVRARPETRERVVKAAKELSYVPHLLARNLRISRAGALGLVMHDPSNPVHGEIISGAQEAVSEAGSVLLLANVASMNNEAAVRQLAATGRIDGLLWQITGRHRLDSLVSVAAEHVPVVLLNSRGRESMRGVYLQDELAGRMATEHLLELGHRRIGFVSGVRGADMSERRRAGYRAAVRAAGVSRDRRWEIDGGWDPQSGQEAMTTLIKAGPDLTAVVVTNSVVAIGVLSALHEAGRRVPEDVSVIAVHDLWFAEHLWPSLSVVRLPLRRMGEEAARLLLSGSDADDGGDVAVPEPPELVRRGSTAPAAR
jgi:DNA-binding LacI/PurR family transcriptional regulator